MCESLKPENIALCELLLSQTEKFTVDDMFDKAQKLNILCTKEDVKNMLLSLREVGVVHGVGGYPWYDVSEEIKMALV